MSWRLILAPRFIPFNLALVLALGGFWLIASGSQSIWALAVFLFGAGFTLLGLHDLFQTRHAVLRNYPIAAHLRFLLEAIRPEMRQYFFEDEKHGMPFGRDKRAIIYQRAKMQLDKRPFGTTYDVYADGFEWMNHSLAPNLWAPPIFACASAGLIVRILMRPRYSIFQP